MLVVQITRLSDLKHPALFEHVFYECAKQVERSHDFKAHIEPKRLARAHELWIAALNQEPPEKLSDRQILALPIAYAIEICAGHSIVRGESEAPYKTILALTSKIARENVNAIVAVMFGGAIFALSNKARSMKLPVLPVMEFETTTIPKLAGLLKSLEATSKERKTSVLFEIVRTFSGQPRA